MSIANAVFGILFSAVLGITMGLSSCAVVESATSDPGVDYQAIAPGDSRVSVEALLGSPVRTWSNEQAVTFVLYEFDGGIAPDPERAGGYLLMDLAFGAGEVLRALTGDMRPRTRQRAVVSYDGTDTVLGVFQEFDKLPGDGRKVEAGR